MLMLLVMLACIPTAKPVDYQLPPGTDHVSLMGGDVRLNGTVIRPWNDANVVNGVHILLLDELNKLDHKKVLIECPEDTPGPILPILFGTVYKAGRTEVAITATASPAMPGPLFFEEVEVDLDPCPADLNPDPRWMGEMQPSLAYRAVFKRVLFVQDEGITHFPITVKVCPKGDSKAEADPVAP